MQGRQRLALAIGTKAQSALIERFVKVVMKKRAVIRDHQRLSWHTV